MSFSEFKALKQVKLCQGAEEVYSVGHSLLSESAALYEINPLRMLVLDTSDYLTHEIYFTSTDEVRLCSSLGQHLSEAETTNFVCRVAPFDYLKDVDFFVKKVEQMEQQRGSEIDRIERGGEVQEEAQE